MDFFDKLQFNVKPSPFDPRDKLACDLLTERDTAPTQEEFMLQDKDFFKVYNQGHSSMCVAFAAAQVVRYMNFVESGKKEDFSYSFIYANRSSFEEDGEGAYIAGVSSQLRKKGACYLRDFNTIGPYSVVRADYEKLDEEVKEFAKLFKIRSYYRVNTRDSEEVKRVLHKYRVPLMLGTAIYPSFRKARYTGVVPVPDLDKEKPLGGHAMCLVGYKYIDEKLYWTVVNSWGEDRGDKGFYYIPAEGMPWIDIWLLFDYEKIKLEVGIGSKVFYKNFTPYSMDVATIVDKGRLLIPIRHFAEAFNFEVKWLPEHRIVRIKEYADLISMQIDNPEIRDVQSLAVKTWEVSPRIINGRTYVPIRFLSESLGLHVSWDEVRRVATVTNF